MLKKEIIQKYESCLKVSEIGCMYGKSSPTIGFLLEIRKAIKETNVISYNSKPLLLCNLETPIVLGRTWVDDHNEELATEQSQNLHVEVNKTDDRRRSCFI